MTYDDSSDRPHAPGPEPEWQESDWLNFYDPACRVGAIFRIGQHPNQSKGNPNLFAFALGGQRFFMQEHGGRGENFDIGPEDRWNDGYQVAGHRVDALGGGQMRYRWDYPESSADLLFYESHHEPRDWSEKGKGEEIMATLNKGSNESSGGHLECCGRVKGRVRVGEQSFDVDCFAHRDRSWGYRPDYVPRTRRIMCAWGTTGPDFSYATMLYEPFDAPALHTGFVARNGKFEEVANIRMITTFDADIVSPIHGKVHFTLDSGELIKFDFDPAQAHAAWGPGTAFDSVGTIDHEGKQGYGVYAVYANLARGQHICRQDEVSLAVAEPGLSDCVDAKL